jgi:hypothetical protein
MTREPLGSGRATLASKAAPVIARPSQSARAVRLGPVAVFIVVLLAVAAGLLPLVVQAPCSSAMPAGSLPR